MATNVEKVARDAEAAMQKPTPSSKDVAPLEALEQARREHDATVGAAKRRIGAPPVR